MSKEKLDPDPHDTYMAARNALSSVSMELATLAKALAITGNSELGKRLICIRQDVETANELFKQSSNAILNERWKEAQQASQNMLDACLAGIQVAKKRSDEIDELTKCKKELKELEA